MQKLAFPVTKYCEFGIRSVRKASNRSLESWVDCDGFLDKILIDSNGDRFKIVNVKKLGVSWYPLDNFFSKDKIVNVEFEYEQLESITLPEMKVFLCTYIDEHPRYFGAKYIRDELKENVQNAKSTKELNEFGFAHGAGTPEELEKAKRKAKKRKNA